MNDIQKLFQQLEQPSTILLTPNRRLSAYFQQSYGEWQQTQGTLSWPTPQIFPFDTWLAICWQTLSFTSSADTALPYLLNSHQARALWQSVISEPNVVDLAQNTYQLLQQWQIPINEQDFNINQNTATFYQWLKQYKISCKKSSFIDETQLAEILCQHFQQQKIPSPKIIILACFEEITPLYQKLLNTLSKQGCQIISFAHPAKQSQCWRSSFDDIDQEITACAQWAKDLLTQGQKNIGIVVPNLTLLRPKIERIFKNILEDDALFNISSAPTFTKFPLIFTTLQYLTLLQSPIELNTISLLLRSPFCRGAETEQNQRALLDAKIHRLNQLKLDLVTLHTLANQTDKPYYSPIFANFLQQLITLQQSLPQTQSISAWLALFKQLLLILGWPGQRALNSEEFQIVNRWQELFTEFASLNFILPSCIYETALIKLKQLAQSTLFQPKSDSAPINVLGLLEASGLPFQSLWIMGLDRDIWPASAQPDPFIPLSLQHHYKLPHTSAAQQLHFSQQLMQGFCHNTDVLIASYHQLENDRKLEASALIQDFPMLDSLPSCYLHSLPLYHSRESGNLFIENQSMPHMDSRFRGNDTLVVLERITDIYGPAITAMEKISGGSFILKEQAACPFRAFAKYRLNANEIDSPQFGLTGAERGSLLHASLEKFWQLTQNQTTLLQYSAEDLRQVISSSVQHAISSSAENETSAISQTLYSIEEKRLSKLLARWLEVEKKRPDFRIASIEHRYTLQFGGLNFQIRIDRVDELADGRKLIIDYKTQVTMLKDCFGPRPTEPQLALYCLSQNDVAGFSFAYIKSDKITFNGISEDALYIQGIVPHEESKLEMLAPNWQGQMTAWHESFTTLATEFSEGYAAVTPKEPVSTCQYCELTTFCRVKN